MSWSCTRSHLVWLTLPLRFNSLQARPTRRARHSSDSSSSGGWDPDFGREQLLQHMQQTLQLPQAFLRSPVLPQHLLSQLHPSASRAAAAADSLGFPGGNRELLPPAASREPSFSFSSSSEWCGCGLGGRKAMWGVNGLGGRKATWAWGLVTSGCCVGGWGRSTAARVGVDGQARGQRSAGFMGPWHDSLTPVHSSHGATWYTGVQEGNALIRRCRQPLRNLSIMNRLPAMRLNPQPHANRFDTTSSACHSAKDIL